MPSVTFDHVTKRFNDVTIVEDFNLQVADGELLVLVGGSGSGKSTILRLVAGLEAVTSGTIRLGDTDITERAPRDRDVAMVFQDYALYPHLSVRENLSLGLRIRRVPKEEVSRRVAWAVDMLGLTELLDRKPKQLSGGQRQRVAMGRAMVREPSAFLFDEPLSNLDAGLRAQMRMEIGALQRRLHTTTIYVTHDQVEAMTLGDRIVVLSSGRVQQIGKPIDLYRAPANRFVAGFIGSPPMNFIEGALEHADEMTWFVSDGMRIALAGVSAAGLTRREVTLGIRPDDLRMTFPSSGTAVEDGSIRGRVELVERLGGSSHMHVHAGSLHILAVVTALELPAVDDVIDLLILPQRVHVFAPDGQAIAIQG